MGWTWLKCYLKDFLLQGMLSFPILLRLFLSIQIRERIILQGVTNRSFIKPKLQNNVTRILVLLKLGSLTTDMIVIDLKSLQVNLSICIDRWRLSSFKGYGKLCILLLLLMEGKLVFTYLLYSPLWINWNIDIELLALF
jgi:hypothetical protein